MSIDVGYGIIRVPSKNPPARGEVIGMSVTEFLLSVMAGVVAYYICKRLDGR